MAVAVSEETLLLDVGPVSKGVDVAFDNGYGADDDSGDAVEEEEATVSAVAEKVEFIVDEAVEFW